MRCMVQSPGPASRHSVAPGEMFPGWHTSGLEGFEMVPSHRSYAVNGDSTATSARAPREEHLAGNGQRDDRTHRDRAGFPGRAPEQQRERDQQHHRLDRDRKPDEQAANPRPASPHLQEAERGEAEGDELELLPPRCRRNWRESDPAQHEEPREPFRAVRSRVHVQIATPPPTMARALRNVTHHAAVWSGASRVIGASSIATKGDPTQPVIA